MKAILRNAIAAAAVLTAAGAYAAHPAMLIGYNSLDAIDNYQEYEAARWFSLNVKDAELITPADAATKINAKDIDCLWINIDRLNTGKGNLPAAFTAQATLDAIRQYLADGGSVLLTKHATQMLSRIGRIDAKFDPNIYGDGDGGKGTDVWALNAQIGYWQLNPDNRDQDASQYYDRRTHDIYAGLEHGDTYNPPIDNFPMEGTGTGAEMWREDHNCCWDLNAYQYTSEGANTVVRFERDNTALVIGTWGHVQDYAVAGVVEFLPTASVKGTVIANGLACCEWSPRNGTNAFADNHRKLTANTITYLQKQTALAGVADITADTDADAPVSYFNLQGVQVNAESLAPGLYIRRQGNTASKVLVK